MYGFPEINELRPLIGQTLVQISCTSNQIIFEFEEKARITCEKGIKLSKKNGKTVEVEIPLNELDLLTLLDSKIEALVGENKDCLVLRFSTGDKVTLFDDDFEAFKLNTGKKEFLV